MTSSSTRELRLRRMFDDLGQSHIFQFWPELTEAQRGQLLDDLEHVDARELRRGLAALSSAGQAAIDPHDLTPVTPFRLPHGGDKADRTGDRLIAHGKVAALTVAGGQGSRLGFRGPKGAFPIGPVSGASLFQLFAESIAGASLRYGAPIPWYIMTSDATHNATVELFSQAGHFGLDPGLVRIFKQGRMPALSPDGRVLLAERHRLALSPDGHGGLIHALAATGMLERMRREGAEQVSVFQVDNPLVHCVDPAFLGLHAQAGADVSCKVIPKVHDKEGLGNLCLRGDKLACIEYSDLPDELATLRNPDGTRRFDAGGISIYAFAVAFLERMSAADLPWHVARKKVACVDGETGAPVAAVEPNAVKLERFLFDVLPLAERTVVCETRRSEEFSPVKNASGADSIETCRRDMLARAREWLERAGVTVPPDAIVEIAPSFADSAEELAARLGDGLRIEPGARVCLR